MAKLNSPRRHAMNNVTMPAESHLNSLEHETMKPFALAVLAFSLITTAANAQLPDFPAPSEEHKWLEQFAGEWVTVSKTAEFGDQPSMEHKGAMTSEMLGGFWAVNRFQGNTGGIEFKALQTIGYDAARKKYVGTWIDSMLDQLWNYEGELDESGKTLVLTAEGPNFFDGGKLTEFRDSYEFKSADLIITTSEIKGPDGKWFTFMTGEMTRAKE
ncbi:MAG: DUF1579 domain-containing protein [Planctomycetota bacterium]|nr:MAG: DUF1579 domain-containing protein [Planctomycetota bacterium]